MTDPTGDALKAYMENKHGPWRSMDSAPTDGTIVNVVGRYPDATAGYPRYAGYRDGQWLEFSRFEPQPLVCWAWRPRDNWPAEDASLTPAPQRQSAITEALEARDLIAEWIIEGTEDLPDDTPVMIKIGNRSIILDELKNLRIAIQEQTP